MKVVEEEMNMVEEEMMMGEEGNDGDRRGK